MKHRFISDAKVSCVVSNKSWISEHQCQKQIPSEGSVYGKMWTWFPSLPSWYLDYFPVDTHQTKQRYQGSLLLRSLADSQRSPWLPPCCRAPRCTPAPGCPSCSPQTESWLFCAASGTGRLRSGSGLGQTQEHNRLNRTCKHIFASSVLRVYVQTITFHPCHIMHSVSHSTGHIRTTHDWSLQGFQSSLLMTDAWRCWPPWIKWTT